jgi:hypothetical protein
LTEGLIVTEPLRVPAIDGVKRIVKLTVHGAPLVLPAAGTLPAEQPVPVAVCETIE